MVNASLLELPGGLLGASWGSPGGLLGASWEPKRSPFWISLILVDVGQLGLSTIVNNGVGPLLVKEYGVYEPNVPQV